MENQDNIKYGRGKNPNSRSGGFKKGNKVWLGKRLTLEHKNSLRLSKLGVKNPMFGLRQSAEFIAKRIKANLGFKHTEQAKRIIGDKHKGNKTKCI